MYYGIDFALIKRYRQFCFLANSFLYINKYLSRDQTNVPHTYLIHFQNPYGIVNTSITYHITLIVLTVTRDQTYNLYTSVLPFWKPHKNANAFHQ